MQKFAAVVTAFSVLVAGPAFAHDEHDFEPVGEAARWRPGGDGRVLFFALADDFQRCLPLSAPCPADSSSLSLVPASRRRVGWVPEGEELPESTAYKGPVRAMGAPPTPHASFRYLVPALDVEGTTIEYLPRRFDGGRLVPLEGGGLPADAQRVVPALVGPTLAGAAPSGELPDRVLERPVVVDAAEVDDAVPALLVRRAPPSRVVFGVRVDDGYTPLVDESGVAVLVRHEGRVGLAMPTGGESGEAVAVPSADEEPRSGDGDDGGFVALGRLGLVVAVLAAATLVWRRRRRSLLGGDSVP